MCAAATTTTTTDDAAVECSCAVIYERSERCSPYSWPHIPISYGVCVLNMDISGCCISLTICHFFSLTFVP